MTERLCANGHLMVILGGTNCGCYPDATCSVPVYYCRTCGDSDYGDNDHARIHKSLCPYADECKVKADPYAGLPAMHMTRKEFDDLDEYSATLPGYTQPGKKWRRHDGAYDPNCKSPVWLIGEYDPGDAANRPNIRINWYIPAILPDDVIRKMRGESA